MTRRCAWIGRAIGSAMWMIVAASPARAGLTGSWIGEGNEVDALYGWVVGTAGDVNGDGYSDVFVGVPNAQAGRGAVHVYLGSPTGASTTPDWTATGNFDGFGRNVSAAGDLNADGFDDLLIGAADHTNGQTAEGRVDLYLGGANGLAASPVWSFESDSALAGLGSVSYAGDVNADGYDDFIVGAPGWDSQRGRVWAWLGNQSGQPTFHSWWGGSVPGHRVGESLGTAGDVDGDGRDEILVGVPTMGWVQLVKILSNGTQPHTIFYTYGNPTTRGFGESVSTAGDVNGDGYADILIGAPRDSIGPEFELNEGVVFVYFGGPTMSDIDYPSQWISSNVAGAGLGASVACAGDVNGDGFSDVVFGAPSLAAGQAYEGRAVAYYGSPSGLESSAFWLADGEQALAIFGACVATVGDVNGDGYSDLIASAPPWDGPEISEGRAAIWHGGADAPSHLARWISVGMEAGLKQGSALAMGDFDADGHADVATGTGLFDASPLIGDHGRVSIHRGGPNGPSSLPDLELTGGDPGDRLGEALAGAHDVNGDGYDDLLVGAPGDESAAGTARLFLGGPAGLASTPAWVEPGPLAGCEFGGTVAWAGDVNGDGFSDAIVGAPLYSDAESNEGAAFLYLGGSVGLSPDPVWSTTGGRLNAALGRSVAGVGDVNIDGYSDIIIGAPGYPTTTGDGAAFIYFGGPSGISAATPWIASDNHPGSDFGWSVAGGDVDGDGRSDAIVGVPQWNGPFLHNGRVVVYTSGSGTFDAIPDHIYSGGQGAANFGIAVAAADLDQDGKDEILGGQPYADNGQVDEGQVLAYKAGSLALYWGADGNAASALHGSAIVARGDVNGDGFPDLLTGAPGQSAAGVPQGGVAILWYGNGGVSHLLGAGQDRRWQARRADDSQAIGLLGAAPQGSMAVAALGRSAMGRSRVALEVEVKDRDDAFDGVNTVVGARLDTGAPVVGSGSAIATSMVATGLAPDRQAKWRARLVSRHPYQKRTPWFSPAGNALHEADVRGSGGSVSAPGPRAGRTDGILLRSLAVHPTPLVEHAAIRFELARAARVRLCIHDVHGRLVEMLLDGERPAGDHSVRWQATDPARSRLAAGVYFTVIEASGERRSCKLVVVR